MSPKKIGLLRYVCREIPKIKLFRQMIPGCNGNFYYGMGK